jgi:hypothetical protein
MLLESWKQEDKDDFIHAKHIHLTGEKKPKEKKNGQRKEK